MFDYIIRFYRLMTFFSLAICTSVVLLFLFYTYYLQNYTDFSNGLKHGLSIATILIIRETHVFMRGQSILFEPIEITSGIVSSEKVKGQSVLKSLRIKIMISSVIIFIMGTLILLNAYPENSYLEGITRALFTSATLFLLVSTMLFVKYSYYISRLSKQEKSHHN